MQKSICLDFDGVLHQYITPSPWDRDGIISDPPVFGSQVFVRSLMAAGYRVYIQSCRATTEAGKSAILEWLSAYGFPSGIRVLSEKPRAAVYMDDRGWRFNGAFPDVADLQAAEPWNRNGLQGTPTPLLIATVGLPRSGKSTWARATGYPVVNPDAIRLALHGRAFVAETEPMVWTLARYMVQSLFIAGHQRVILDATNGTAARRSEWLSSKWQTEFRVFGTPIEVCIDRAVKDDRADLVPVIQRMAASWQEPQYQDPVRVVHAYRDAP